MELIRFSPAAMSAGAISDILINTTQSEIDEQKAKSVAQQTNGLTATFTSKQISDALEDQASGIRANAYGSIGSGVAQGGSEALADTYDFGRSKNNEQEKNTTVSKRLDNWDSALEESKEAAVVGKVKDQDDPKLAPPSKEKVDQAIKKLNDVKVHEADAENFKDEIETVKASKDQAAKEDCLDKLQKKITAKKETYNKRIESFNNTTTRRTDKLRAYGRAAGDLARGFQQAEQARYTDDQAYDEALKNQAQFASDSGKSGIDSVTKDLDNKKAVKDSTIQLMSSLISENRI